LTIGIDATYSLGDNLSGVGVYSRELLMGLAAVHPDMRFDWFYRPHRYFRSWAEDVPGPARRRLLWESLAFRAPALFHGLNQRLPKMRLRRSIATFHDLFVMTGDYSTAEFRARFAEQARDAARRADAVIAVSAFTASQVVQLLNVEPGKVTVVHHGVRQLALRPVAREKIVLNVGAVQVRKNIARLVEAFEGVGGDWRLVLAGSAGFGSGEILRRIEASRARDRIQVLGYVSPDELADWYSRASVFAFPSIDEGFGMPVLEAMAAGIPVLTSNRSALPEIAGKAAVLVDPSDTAALTQALRDLTQNGYLRDDLTKRGYAHVRAFTWENAIRRTWDIYSTLLA
jgi:glycosyltransferase involved in cell wall biosynthesis